MSTFQILSFTYRTLHLRTVPYVSLSDIHILVHPSYARTFLDMQGGGEEEKITRRLDSHFCEHTIICTQVFLFMHELAFLDPLLDCLPDMSINDQHRHGDGSSKTFYFLPAQSAHSGQIREEMWSVQSSPVQSSPIQSSSSSILQCTYVIMQAEKRARFYHAAS